MKLSGNNSIRDNRLSLAMLLVGGLIGIVVATIGFIDGSGTGDLPAGVIASVNDCYINAAKYQMLLENLEKDKRQVLSDQDQSYVLERLIEEELLIQRGIELGLLESDNTIRGSIVQAMIKSVIMEAAAEEISEDELKSFYQDNSDFFAFPEQLRLRQINFRRYAADKKDRSQGLENARIDADKAWGALKKGIPFQTALKRYGDPVITSIPNTLLPPAKLREYIGPELLKEAMKMNRGKFSRPLETPSGYRILFMADRVKRRQHDMEAVRRQVEAEYRKRKDDEALRDYIDRLKDWADITRGRTAI